MLDMLSVQLHDFWALHVSLVSMRLLIKPARRGSAPALSCSFLAPIILGFHGLVQLHDS
jgi:hypothetical protein